MKTVSGRWDEIFIGAFILSILVVLGSRGLLDRNAVIVLFGTTVVVCAIYAAWLPYRKRIMAPRLREWALQNGLTLVDFEETSPFRWPSGSTWERYWKIQVRSGNVFRITVQDREGQMRKGWLLHAKYVVPIMGGGIAEVIWDDR